MLWRVFFRWFWAASLALLLGISLCDAQTNPPARKTTTTAASKHSANSTSSKKPASKVGTSKTTASKTPASKTAASKKRSAKTAASKSALQHNSRAASHHPTSRHSTSQQSTVAAKRGARTSKSKRKTPVSWRNRGQQKIDPQRAHDIQDALIREHYLDGSPSGVWDDETQKAMQRYQADQGWQSTMTPDSRALIKLGLGPDHAHLLNPESAMTSGADPPHAAPPATAPPTAPPATSPSVPVSPTPPPEQDSPQADPPKK